MKRVLVLLIVLACHKSSNELATETWGVRDYAEAGLDIAKPWTSADHAHAAEVLAKVTDGHRDRLPHYRGAKSGAVFDKLIAPLPPDGDRPINERFLVHSDRYNATNAISKLYFKDLLGPTSREGIELFGALLREATILRASAEDFLTTFGPDDPKREVRAEGLAKMNAGYGLMLVGCLQIAADTRQSMDDRVAIVKHVTAALPVLFAAAPAETRQQIRKQLLSLAQAKGELGVAIASARDTINN